MHFFVFLRHIFFFLGEERFVLIYSDDFLKSVFVDYRFVDGYTSFFEEVASNSLKELREMPTHK